MKKLWSTLLILVMCCGLMAGCGDDGSEAPDEVVEQNAESEQDYVDNSEEVDLDESSDDELTPEEKAEKEKERQESLTIYADMISEIQTDFPEMEVQYVVSTKDGGKELFIDMPLLESEDATIRVMAELTVLKETLLNDNGITSIIIFVRHNEECEGIIIFENYAGSFEAVVNTL